MKKSALPLSQTPSSSSSAKLIHGREALVKLLRWHFGHSDFRGKQFDAIEAVLSGRDCFCLMPTGGGKSMCYQVPALANKTGIVLVVCPLIEKLHNVLLRNSVLKAALMENQVAALKQRGIAAEYLSSTQTANVKKKIHEEIDSGKPYLRLLYVTPELIATSGFMSKLTKMYSRGLLNLIAIDEAHCISSWGHDFRPGYRKLSTLRNQLPGVPILALTATAAPKVQEDVIQSLCLQDPLVLKSSFNRPNIYYEVRYKDLLNDAYADLFDLLKSEGNVCGIIYCLERTACDDLSAHLSKVGISCAAYHAGLNDKLRTAVLENWISSKIQVVVATVAFGMGIDRKDVRIVCHFNIPKSMESFYQESGRAGRDQLPSKSLLYYTIDDRKKMEFILRNAESKKSKASSSQDTLTKNSLTDFHRMVEYCESSGCRRKKILENFGEQVPASLCRKSCDACKHPNLVAKQLEELRTTCVYRGKFSSSQIFMGSTADKGCEGDLSEFWNRDDEASGSEEAISDSDDDVEVVKNLSQSKLLRKSGLSERLEILQRAEERYNGSQNSNDPDKKPNKNTVSDTLRESSRQRIQNALKQALQRHGNSNLFQVDESATCLENECFNKYGRTGKSFYYSQVASTVRWISNANPDLLTDRLGNITSPISPSENFSSKGESPASNTPVAFMGHRENTSEDVLLSIGSQTPTFDSPLESDFPANTKLPLIPSFSEFINSKKVKESQSRSSRIDSEDRGEKKSGKRFKFQ